MAEKGLVTKLIARFILGLVFIGAILFGTAGTLNWPEAWVYIVIQFGWSAVLTVWLWVRFMLSSQRLFVSFS